MLFSDATNKIFSILVIAGQVLIVVLASLFVFRREDRTLAFFNRNVLWLILTVALLASLGSLFYSDIVGYLPCSLCWFQRIFMYPVVVISTLALWKKDRQAIDYILGLSLVGAFIAGYQYFLQIGLLSLSSGFCSISGGLIECAKTDFLEFGYITMPMMSFTVFLLLIIFSAISKFSKRTSN